MKDIMALDMKYKYEKAGFKVSDVTVGPSFSLPDKEVAEMLITDIDGRKFNVVIDYLGREGEESE